MPQSTSLDRRRSGYGERDEHYDADDDADVLNDTMQRVCGLVP